MPALPLTNLAADLRSLGQQADAPSATLELEPDWQEWRPGMDRDDDQATSEDELASLQEAEITAGAQQAISAPSSDSTLTPEAAALSPDDATAWAQQLAEVAPAFPELQDAESAFSHDVRQVLQEAPVYTLAPEGFRQAALLVQARAQAAAVPPLQAQLETLARENTRLARLTSIAGSPPLKSAPAHDGSLTERDLRRLAREADLEGNF